MLHMAVGWLGLNQLDQPKVGIAKSLSMLKSRVYKCFMAPKKEKDLSTIEKSASISRSRTRSDQLIIIQGT